MAKLFINKDCKNFSKADKATKKSIIECLDRLAEKIEKVDKDFRMIFNMDSITYDRINSQIFIYKCRGIDSTQLRIVYGVTKDNDGLHLYLVDFYNKKNNDKKYIGLANRKYKNVYLAGLTFEEVSAA